MRRTRPRSAMSPSRRLQPSAERWLILFRPDRQARAPEPQHEPRAVPNFSRRSGKPHFDTFGRHLLEHEQACKVVAASSLRAVGAVAQAVQRSRSLRAVAFDCFGRLPLSLRSEAQARHELQDRRSRTGSRVERHRPENEVEVAWPSTSHRAHRGSARRTSRWSPS